MASTRMFLRSLTVVFLGSILMVGCDPGLRVNQLRITNELPIPVLITALGDPNRESDPPPPFPIPRQLGVVRPGEAHDFDSLVNHFQVFTLNHRLIGEAATNLYPLQNFTWDVTLSHDTKGNVFITYPKDIQEDRQWILWLAVAIPLIWLGYRQEKRRLKASRTGAKTQMRIPVDRGSGGKGSGHTRVQPGVPNPGGAKSRVPWEAARRHPADVHEDIAE